jgi:hypothetical protein
MQKNPTLSELFPLPESAKRLSVFVGNWRVEGTLTFGGNPLNVTGAWVISSAAAGWGVINIGRLEIEGMGAYEEIDLLGFDSGENLVHLFSLTNTAATHDHKGTWSDDKTLKLLYEGLQEGRKLKEQITIVFNNKDEWDISEVDTLDGQAVSTMDITLRRQTHDT